MSTRHPFLRTRFLVAMGLPVLACTKEKPTPETSTPPLTTTTATATPTETASAIPSASATATSAPTTTLGHTGGGGCGFIIMCEPAPAAPPKVSAPKPYERCAATTPEAMQGTDPHREGPFDEELTKDRRARSPNICCYKAPRALCGGGRPLRAEDGFVVAPPASRTDWSASFAVAVPDAERAARFLADAAAEHASVASFARASLQLLALGAPPSLVRDAHLAALDEIEHARTCFALAQRRGAAATGPGPLAIDRAPFETSLASFVRDTFLDGCVAETVSALDARARSTEGDAVERLAFERIAADEDRHAELAWRMLAWAVREGGVARSVLAAELTQLRHEDDSVIREVVLPCADALLA